MRFIVTGGCGFVGQAICREIVEHLPDARVVAFDNLRRAGSELNRQELARRGVVVVHGDVRCQSDVDALGDCDWLIDAAAEPSVLAGTAAMAGRGAGSRQLLEHNLLGTVNLLEAAARRRAGIVILSTSRVYSITALTSVPLREHAAAFEVDPTVATLPHGVTQQGITEDFSTAAPVSLYGATKLASEALAFEYADLAGVPVIVNRCGVLAGAGQFGRADQGIFSWWIHSWARRRPLRYIGFGGQGLQVRDCLHPADLARLVILQTRSATGPCRSLLNVSGGAASATSLAQLSAWCSQRLGNHDVAGSLEERPYDLPWVVLDHARVTSVHGWTPEHPAHTIFEEIARHAERHPDWLDITGG
jgi:CDP-paratose 2-epimerase